LLFVVCRFDTADGSKELIPYGCTAAGWRWKAPDAPRPLYGLDRLAARQDAPVLVVEGEKAADAAAALFPEHVTMTWPGGSNAVRKVDWTPLAGRYVAVWGDADAAGSEAAAAVAKALAALPGTRVAAVPIPASWPPAWDLADFGNAERAQPEGVTLDTLQAMLANAGKNPPAGSSDAAEALRMDVERAARMDHAEWLTTRRDTAKRHGVPVGELASMRAQRMLDDSAERKAETPTLSKPPTDPRGRADLFINGADLPDVADELAGQLARVPYLFDRGGPARLSFDVQRGAPVANPLNVNGVVNEAHRICRLWTLTRTRDGAMERRDVTLPERVAKLYLDLRGRWRLPPLDGIASAPLLHPDGTLHAAEGYDPETRLWCQRVPPLILPDTPSKEDAAAALMVLRRHLRTFAFADAERGDEAGQPVPVVDLTKPPGGDESAALVALLTAICRPSLRLAPALLVRAPQYSGSGTGKGLLVRIICAVAFGVPPSAMTAGGDPAELDKRLAAALIEAAPVVFLDNLNATALKSHVLASAITECPAVVRPLGRSVTVSLNPTALVAVTGNGVMLSEDIARRFLTVELDAGIEDPEARDFRGDLVTETMEAREMLLTAALTIWRWGRQRGDALPSGRAMGSFSQWGRWCRDPLLALGCQDPAMRVQAAKAADPRRQNIAELFTAWWQAHGPTPVAAAGLADAVQAVADPVGRGRQYLAARIRALDGTRAAGFVLTRSPSVETWNADLYALTKTRNAEGSGPASPIGPMPYAAKEHDADNLAPVPWRDTL
jgi:hypothetical protein